MSKSALRQNVESFGIAIFVALAIRSSIVQAYWVPSESMLPTIQVGDHLFVNKVAYSVRLPFLGTEIVHRGEPQRGDIVVFKSPKPPHIDLIKRVVAVAGDTVEIRDKQLYINGERAHYDQVIFTDPSPHRPYANFGPVTVGDGKFFVLGDNRDRSNDSRMWGFADVDDIAGRAMFIYFSWDKQEKWPRFERIGRFLE